MSYKEKGKSSDTFRLFGESYNSSHVSSTHILPSWATQLKNVVEESRRMIEASQRNIEELNAKVVLKDVKIKELESKASTSKHYVSFVVFVVREGVTIRNPKMDSKSEFGGPNTAKEREQSAKGPSKANDQAWCHVCHTASMALYPRVPHMVLTWHMLFGCFFSLSLSSV
ncbi:hypothetical protein QYF36_015659 [Acer negundo]|nr:hypothetical protein QYF36_015659 [Acer negundo]